MADSPSETVKVADLPLFDLSDATFWQDPYPAITAAREASPIAVDTDGALWIMRAREAEDTLKDPAFVVTDFMGMLGLSSGPVWEWWQQLMTSKNPPEHTRIRRLVSRAFTVKSMEALRPMVRQVADQLVNEAVAAGSIDVLAGHGIAHRLPSTVMATMLGVPEADIDFFIDATSEIGLAFGAATDPEIRGRVERALDQLDDYVRKLVTQAREKGDGGEDLLSQLLVVEEDGDQLSTDEIVALVENLLFAGHDTTRGAIAVALALLALHPDQLADLRADGSLVANAVDEVLRYEAITFSTSRATTKDCIIGNVEVPAGSPILFCLPAASRDPRRYDDPERFDIHRVDPHPPTFGAGVHYCLGAALARVELQEMLHAVLDLTADFTLEHSPQWVPFAYIRRYEALTVSFTAS